MLSQNPDDSLLYASLDETGFGSLIGPVVVGCVVWQEGEYDHLINDSKKLSPVMRKKLSEYIKDNAIDYSITFIDQVKIDEINILNANMAAMHECLDKLSVDFNHILVDGNKFREYHEKPHTCIIKGDSKYVSIAAASIIAKVARDEYINTIAQEYPQYYWDQNMGYGTKQHIDAILENGATPYHRQSFLKNIL